MGLSSAPMADLEQADLEQVNVLFGEHDGLLPHILHSGSQGFCIRVVLDWPCHCLQACLQGAPLYLASVLARRLCDTSIRSVCVCVWWPGASVCHNPLPSLPVSIPASQSQFCVLVVVVTRLWLVGCSQLHGLDV